MTSQDHVDKLAMQLGSSLRRTGVNFVFVWLISVCIVVAASFYREGWLAVTAMGLFTFLFFVVCLPNIGRTMALNKIHGGLDRALRRHVFLADIGALATAYTVAAMWWALPLAALAAVVGMVVAFVNSHAGGNDV